ncbi:MAG TPA: DUF5682 family protein [Longimicrobium sp.]|nr:DUF5682 family protein [Longimicrobium sp.]
MTVRVFGIRHHGPGSARSLGRALEAWAPDAVLIEGPPEADALLPLASHEEMRPPVSILVYDPDQPRRAGYWPFAEFSPEWRAIRHALERGVPVRFIDLPQSHRIAERIAEEAETTPADGDADRSDAPSDDPALDDGSSSVDESPSIDGSQSVDASPSIDRSPFSDGSPSIDESPSPDGSPSADESPSADDDGEMPAEMREDPLDWLARASGHGDGERWWEEMVEQRRGDDAGLFDAIAEAMTALRAELAMPESRQTLLREAFMRQQIRAAEREGFERIAVVCGAWHVPALATRGPAKDDAALLKGLPKAKVAATWVPWTYGRLAFASGYGAGVSSPGWYGHLWEAADSDPRAIVVGWLSKAARLLRSEDLDASPAQIVDAARLAESLAALRGLPIPGLGELNEAAQAVFWGGGPAVGGIPPQMRLIHERLVVGERLGAVPADAPAVPLQQDLARQSKRLRMPAEAGERTLELDLRKPLDLDRSHLLHRLVLLGIPWGSDEAVRGKRGTFHEHWRLRWEPEMAVSVIEASVWGNTVEAAADARVRGEADRIDALPPLAEMLDRVLLARLPGAARHLIARIDAEAARAADTAHLMHALPPLARALRYGSVRGGGGEVLEHVVDALVARIAIGLPAAVASLDDDAAAAMLQAVAGVHGAVTLLQDERHRADWTGALQRVAGQAGVHGAVAGRAVRLLFDVGAADADEAARRMGLALSTASDAGYAGAWVEGFLAGSGLVLLHDERLWSVLDGWLAALEPDAFTQLLPLLRRTFATYPAAERRALGTRARRGVATVTERAAVTDFDVGRAEAVLPLLGVILGIEVW